MGYSKSQGNRPNEPLSPREQEWASNVMIGGIIWSVATKDNPWEGEAESYDFTLMYPSILADSHKLWPVGA
ncbi:4165_t:CDS:1, partial [Paraglomus occultum]